jgi:hypothetical protein
MQSKQALYLVGIFVDPEDGSSIFLKTLVNIYQITLYHITEASILSQISLHTGVSMMHKDSAVRGSKNGATTYRNTKKKSYTPIYLSNHLSHFNQM